MTRQEASQASSLTGRSGGRMPRPATEPGCQATIGCSDGPVAVRASRTRQRGGPRQVAAPPRFDLVPAARLLALRGDVTDLPDGDPAAWGWERPDVPAPPVLAVDVGADAAVAVLSDAGALVVPFRFPRLDDEGLRALSDALRTARAALPPGRCLAIVEDSFAGAPGRANPATKAGLDRRIGALVAWLGVGGPVVRVRAVSWQGKIIGKASREDGKARSLAAARARFPRLAIPSADCSDALLMALFGRKGRMPR